MNYHFGKFKFNNKTIVRAEKTTKNKRRTVNALASLALIVLLISAPVLVSSVSATSAEPSLPEIFSYLGFTNVALVNVETFPAGVYEVMLFAEFAGYNAENVLSYYPVGTSNYYTIFSGPEGATGQLGGYVVPPVSNMIAVDTAFGLSMLAPEYRYFTEHWRNPDYPIHHAEAYENLDYPGMFLIGFENLYGVDYRDYNDMVFALVQCDIPELVSVSHSPQTPNYDQSVTVTAQVAKGSFDIDSVVLSYQIGAGSWTNVSMTLGASGYVADIPVQSYATTVNYKIYVSDIIGYHIVSSVYSYTVGDFVNPVISNVDQTPTVPSPNQVVTVSVKVTEPAEASGVKDVTLWYNTASIWTPVTMTLNGDVWKANIAGQASGNAVNYYVEAFDNAGNSAKTSTYSYNVVMPNDSPVADFTTSPSTVYTGTSVDFDASSSYDPDGFITTYFWTFGDGTFEYGVNPTHSYADNGEYAVTLVVTDNRGATDTKTGSIIVNNRPPVADITSTNTIVDKKGIITFSATGSYDLDGTIVSYSWSFGDGTTATGLSASHSYSNSGVYTVTLTVTDDDGATGTATERITVRNQAPIAIFTESAESVYVDAQITFNAADSYDPDGTVVSYSWSFGDGTTATGVTAEHAYTENGVYTVTLTVTDNEGATGSETSAITVMNMKPVAAFTVTPETGNTNTDFTFDASESYDPDGTIVSYSWSFGDGTTATGVSVIHAYSLTGTYTVTLTITDDDGAAATATKTKTIPNQAPVAIFTESAEIVSTGDSIQFDASESYDVDGTIVSYSWSFGDGTTATGVTTSHEFSENGEYTVTLTVTDNDGETDSITATKTVLNRQPVAALTASATTASENEAIQFDGSESYDVDGTVVSYVWDFGDGTTATGVTAEHAYSQAAEYTVTLTVTDNDGDSASETTTITVEPALQLAILSVFGLGIAALTLTLLYGLFIRRRKKNKQNED